MANHGGAAGAKFVSVNLNKSYGQPSAHHNYPPYSGSYGPAGANRGRMGSHASGGGGGMVVLSRNRPLQKVVPKLSVPPPLNLPSLRKEHEKLDLSGSGGGAAGNAGPGSGSKPSSSGVGWTKPGTVALQDKEGSDDTKVAESDIETDGVSKGNNGTYMPPSVRLSGGLGHSFATSAQSYLPPLGKGMVLRGEDFPSLRAALPTPSGPGQKQKDSLHLSSPVHARPQGKSSHRITSEMSDNGGRSHRFGSARTDDQSQKQEDPLPLLWLNPRSDWADDERDTGHGFADRTRDHGLHKSEAYWERDFDMPRSSILPHKPPLNLSERRGQHNGETGKGSSTEVLKLDPYRKDLNPPSREDREGNTWRNSSIKKDGSNVQESVNDRSDISRWAGLSRDVGKDSKSILPSLGDNGRHGLVTGNRDSASGRRDMGHGQQGGQQHWNHTVEPFSSRGTERNMRDRYGTEQSNRYRGDAFQNSTASKSLFSPGGKGLPMNDPLLNFGREKRAFSKSERSYIEDPYLKDFSSSVNDERDPFSGNLVGVVKRKKDAVKQADFHDPVRESFEAELERVQKMQEMERQRIIEEQEKALEQARREEEERRRLIREEEERRRRMEEEAREAAWREEQERLEAIHKAEEHKIAREEEKRRNLMEEERRKQAAKQKLLELEARIAKRQAEVPKSDDTINTAVDEEVSASGKEKDVSMAADLDNWEDSERMVERITTSASSDSSILNRSFDRPHPSREGSSSFVDRGKPVNPWRRDVFDNGNNSSFLLPDKETSHHSPRRDASIGGRGFPGKEFYGGGGYMSSRSSFKGGMQEPQADGFPHLRDNRWNTSGDGDPYTRNRDIELEFYDNVAEKYDVGWGQGHSRSNARSPYPERLYLNSEPDDLYSYGRARYSMRQPRVLPPPSLASVPKTSLRGENEHSGPSTSIENGDHYNHAARSESTVRTGYYSDPPEKLEQSELVDVGQEIMAQKLDKNATQRCDSQSSLSVSSPPSSPTHLSHDELDESADSPVIPTAAEGKEILLSGSEPEVLHDKSGKENMMAASNSISAGEDEEWSLENNEEMQEQEEYDEDDNAYQEEDEVHEGDDENIDLTQEFEHMHLEEKSTSDVMDNLVLGFNEGVEVGIPGDEFERDSMKEDNKFGPEVSLGIMVDQGSSDGVRGDGQILQQVIHVPEKAIQDSLIQPLNTSHTSTISDLLNSVDASTGSGLSGQHTVPSSVDVGAHSSSVQATMSASSSVPSQADLPVKLQFGLFSGPSLIPSPVPAIQIGSIQMPLHLHSAVGPSISHIHPSQPPPLFQFGQLRYTSPVSQGILPMAPQPMSFVQPNIHTPYNPSQNSGGSLPIQSSQETSTVNMRKDDVTSLSVNNQRGIISTMPDLSHEKWSRGLTGRGSAESIVMSLNSQNDISHAADNRNTFKPGSQAEEKVHHDTVVKNYIPSSDEKGSEDHLQFTPASSLSRSSEKDFTLSKAPGPLSGNKGKKIAYSVRNSGTRSTFPASDVSRSGPSEFQRRPRRAIHRTEFRVRENVDRRQTSGLAYNNSGLDDKSNSKGVGNFVRSGYRRGPTSTKSLRQIVESESLAAGPSNSQEPVSENRAAKGTSRQALTRTQAISHAGEGNLKRNISEEDVDAPLQSGIVRIFKQPGIEAPSDEDDFIEVRSKRQMLNDRREQREKEIKAKSRVTKLPRKSRSSVQGAVVSTSSNKISRSLGGEASNSIHSDFVGSEGRGLVNKEASTGFSTMVSQPLAPIGTPAVTADVQADIRSHTSKSLQTGSVPAISSSGKDLGPNLIFETKNKVLDNVQTSLGAWGNARIDQQVMALTQTQLDEAMKPARFDTHVTSIGDHSTSVSEPILPSSSILTKDKSISSSASPINSLLAGEKIQFGAVTSPTVLPPSTRIVSHAIGAPGSLRSEVKISQNLSKAENDCTLFFEKDKHSCESCVLLEDCEAEAEAAASAIAVAAISTDELVGNVLGSVPVSDTKSFGGADVDGIPGDGLAGDQQSGGQSRPEESLSASLPADLSFENPPISLWPPLPSPQSSSTHMLSHFPGAPPSHFPFYDMNHPMLGGPIFAFGPHEESGGTQSQSQKSSVSGSGHIGAWQQCHSAVDSFYGPPAGFTGPFISPPGGVQAPPHMVVYNHYAPVGQFGQVGLSFMGATYIPSGKQPDWKHNPTSSAMCIGEGDMNAMNMVSAQRNPPTMPPSIQHLAPGSPLLPMGSLLAMFDVPPFQTAPDMSVQPRWSHVPALPLHSVPMSLPLQQQQAESVTPSQFSSHGHPIDQSLNANRFSESQASTPSDNNGRAFPVVRDPNITQFPDELGLVDISSTSAISTTSTQVSVSHVSSGSTISNVGKSDANAIQRGNINISNSSSNGQNMNTFKNQHTQPKNFSGQHYNHSTGGYGHQRGGPSQKNNSAGEWSQRRMGFHGRHQSLGAEKNFPSSKMKQIYVAKQTQSGPSSTVG